MSGTRPCLGVPPATCGQAATTFVYDPKLRRTVPCCDGCKAAMQQRIALHAQQPIRTPRRVP